MGKDKTEIPLSQTMVTALKELERIELDFLIEEPNANLMN